MIIGGDFLPRNVPGGSDFGEGISFLNNIFDFIILLNTFRDDFVGK